MLIRALLMAVPLALVSTTPAHADEAPVLRMLDDFRTAQRVTSGEGATVAIVSDGVANSRALNGAVKRRLDLVRWPRAKMIAGTAAATMLASSGPRPGSQKATRGLVPDVDLLSVRVEDGMPAVGRPGVWLDDRQSLLFLSSGIRWAANHGADVIWTFYAWQPGDKGLEEAVEYAVGKGAVVVQGAQVVTKDWPGGRDGVSDPAALPGVIGVGTVNLNGNRLEEYSPKNRTILVSAPGMAVPATGPRGEPYSVSGSMAAASWVVAAAAMIKAKYPKLSPALVVQALATSARRPDQPRQSDDIETAAWRSAAEPASYDTSIGFGLVNAAGALKVAGRLAAMRPGADAVAPGSRFGGAPVQKIKAVRHDKAMLTGYAGAIAGGGLLLSLASVVIVRGRRSHYVDIDVHARERVEYPRIS
ncbi:S8 family serine peptidase [Nonomuraea africana]|uniref:Peptidase S8/S53 domain-containing protein n=1 Tax=Nonomuraea africana TaxID=46171 RepID=A0ABR9KGY1_9ACTN|nr:S8 family serine peptidase [Nonomuraea africana]MBE1561075.1 hypothetical protein [Nonomuraea africana]